MNKLQKEYMKSIGIFGDYQYALYPSPAPNKLSFGKKKIRKKSKKKIPKVLKNKAKQLKIRLTVTRNGKRIYKSKSTLVKQIKKKI